MGRYGGGALVRHRKRIIELHGTYFSFLLFPGGTQDTFERKKNSEFLWAKNLSFVWGCTGVERWYGSEKELWNFTGHAFLFTFSRGHSGCIRTQKKHKILNFCETKFQKYVHSNSVNQEFVFCMGRYGGGALVRLRKRIIEFHGTCFSFYFFQGAIINALKNGFATILSQVTSRFHKLFWAIPNKNAMTVVCFICQEIYYLHLSPGECVIYDLGPEFVNEICQALLASFGTEIRITTAGRP